MRHNRFADEAFARRAVRLARRRGAATKWPVLSDLRTGLIPTGKKGEPNIVLPTLPHPT
jgi:hypothetical protein